MTDGVQILSAKTGLQMGGIARFDKLNDRPDRLKNWLTDSTDLLTSSTTF
ncbi:Uncharacterized protein dnm_044370 [Desulfonema magnum]|uniref:Uncharacterized protein n=1 Tax=Desulfonema magnum TaxID=45655 RepID=A0A975GP26_9BACT|nr:Uncharacterized protein dnm_044370 [Desulfonema magnum]